MAQLQRFGSNLIPLKAKPPALPSAGFLRPDALLSSLKPASSATAQPPMPPPNQESMPFTSPGGVGLMSMPVLAAAGAAIWWFFLRKKGSGSAGGTRSNPKRHMGGRKRYKRSTHGTIVHTGKKFCRPCLRSVSPSGWKRHIRSKSHKRRLRHSPLSRPAY